MNEQALLMTKVVHDLVNPLTAVVNITDMLATDKEFLDEALPVLQTAVQNLQKKLKFFRVAYGTPGPIDKAVVDDYLTTLSVPVRYTGSCDHRAALGLLGGVDVLLPQGGSVLFSEQSALLQADKYAPVIKEVIAGSLEPNNKNILLILFINTFGARFEQSPQGVWVRW